MRASIKTTKEKNQQNDSVNKALSFSKIVLLKNIFKKITYKNKNYTENKDFSLTSENRVDMIAISEFAEALYVNSFGEMFEIVGSVEDIIKLGCEIKNQDRSIYEIKEIKMITTMEMVFLEDEEKDEYITLKMLDVVETILKDFTESTKKQNKNDNFIAKFIRHIGNLKVEELGDGLEEQYEFKLNEKNLESKIKMGYEKDSFLFFFKKKVPEKIDERFFVDINSYNKEILKNSKKNNPTVYVLHNKNYLYKKNDSPFFEKNFDEIKNWTIKDKRKSILAGKNDTLFHKKTLGACINKKEDGKSVINEALLSIKIKGK